MPDCLTGANLDGSLAATAIDLAPKDPVLAKSGVSIACSLVDGFQSVRRELEGKQGKGYRSELHFVAHFADDNGCAKLEQYMVVCGETKAALSVKYNKQAQLPGVEETEAASE